MNEGAIFFPGHHYMPSTTVWVIHAYMHMLIYLFIYLFIYMSVRLSILSLSGLITMTIYKLSCTSSYLHAHIHSCSHAMVHLIMRLFTTKKIILQIAALLSKLQQLLHILNGPVQVWHVGVSDVCPSPFQNVQNFMWSILVFPRVDTEWSTWQWWKHSTLLVLPAHVCVYTICT